MDAVKPEWDDVSDLTPAEMSSAKEWELQFAERYDFVGRLVRTEAEIRDHTGDDDEADHEGDGPEGSSGEKKDL